MLFVFPFFFKAPSTLLTENVNSLTFTDIPVPEKKFPTSGNFSSKPLIILSYYKFRIRKKAEIMMAFTDK